MICGDEAAAKKKKQLRGEALRVQQMLPGAETSGAGKGEETGRFRRGKRVKMFNRADETAFQAGKGIPIFKWKLWKSLHLFLEANGSVEQQF